MTLRLDDKRAIVADLHTVASGALSAVAADYRGLTVSEMTELRAKARDAGVHTQVVRNTLAKRAFEDTSFACLDEALVGPIILFFSKEEPSAAARVLRDFVKEHENLEVKALSIGGECLGPEQLKAVASLPNKEEAIAMLLSVMIAPVTKLARTTAELYSQPVRVFGAVRDQKQAN